MSIFSSSSCLGVSLDLDVFLMGTRGVHVSFVSIIGRFLIVREGAPCIIRGGGFGLRLPEMSNELGPVSGGCC